MSYIQADIRLPEIARTVGVHLYFPTDVYGAKYTEVQGVITLLHGYGNNGADWMHMTAACRYAADNGYILVAPDANNSFYIDMPGGTPYYTALTELLPARLQAAFNIPAAREKNFLAGLSMGGYGAMHIGLAHPQRYAAIGSFSGALDLCMIAEAAKIIPEAAAIIRPVLGSALTVSPEQNLMHQLRQCAQLPKEHQPRLYCSCGRQDDDFTQIYTQNQNFRQLAETLPVDYTYAEWDGVHEWNFWDRSLVEFIGFIQNSDYAKRKQADWSAPSEVFPRDA